MIQSHAWLWLAFVCWQQVPLEAQNPVGELPHRTDATDAAAKSEPSISLQFREHEWLPALQWLAERLEMNLDWQDMPTDKLSLASTHKVTIEEAEDLFNMQLLARGYTLLKRGSVLRLVTLKDLDITLVPRIEPESLEDLPKHTVARVSFPLEWMIADEAAKELAPLLSPYGKLSSMASSNRLEVIDAVVNLREFYKLLLDAEQHDSRRERVVEFHLEHRKAEEVAPKVRQLLGLPPDGQSVTTQTQLDIEQTRFRAEAVKQLGPAAQDLVTEKKPTVFLTVNEKENSLLVNAPPNKIEIVRQAVKAIDKPLPENDSAWDTLSRVKVYDVSGFDPEAITKLFTSLQERGSVSKDSRIQHEAAYNRIIAFASPSDQLTIAQLIESFRAEKRTATVLPLSSVDPIYAAKAVQVILKSPDRPSRTPGVPSDGKFQIEPDPQHHRLLLWATPNELRDVREFLARLGESFGDSPSDSKLHIIDLNGQNADEVVDRLKRVWGDLSDTPIVYEPEANTPAKEDRAKPVLPSTSPQSTPATPKSNPNAADVSSSSIRNNGEGVFVARFDGELPHLLSGSSQSVQESPPVRLMRGEQGDMVIVSRDPTAAQTAKRLLQQMIKDTASLRVIALKHAQATVVKRQLDSMFLQSTTTTAPKLSTTVAPTIDVDARTNRLLVQNASDRQLSQIEETVEILDQPSDQDEKLEREKVTYRFRYRKAASVLEALKTIYADLITINDKTLTNIATRASGFNKNLAATSTSPEYQGLLSLGVDNEANLLLISAPKYLIDDVLKVVKSMDTELDGSAIAIIPSFDLPLVKDSKDTKVAESLKRILSYQKKP